MAGRESRVRRRNRGKRTPFRIPGMKESGVSEVVGTILILGLVVIVMSAAIFMVETRLPHTTPTSANVAGMNVTLQSSPQQKYGYLAGSFVYSSGPTLSVENFHFLVIANGSHFYYNISSFAKAGNSWSQIVPGTQVLFDSSVMTDTQNALMSPVPVNSNYTFNILDKGAIIWTWASSATTYNAKPVIANSWWDIYTNTSIYVYAAVNGLVGKVTGDFSQIYGAGYANLALNKSTSYGVYYILLTMPFKTGYYEISASEGNYVVSQWYQLQAPNLSAVFTVTYNITFHEGPLLTGSLATENWVMSISGPTGLIPSGNLPPGGTFWVYLPNGTYTVTATAGTSKLTGNMVVNGGNEGFYVDFSTSSLTKI